MPFLNFTRLDSLDIFFQDKISVERVESSKMSTLVYTVNGIQPLEHILTHYFCDTLFSHSPLRRVVSGESSVGREEGEKRELHSKPYKIVEFKEMVIVQA